MTRQNERQASIRAATGTTYTYNDDWRALFDQAGIAAGSFNDRLRAWINDRLGTSYVNVNDAMRAFAVDQGFTRWDEMGTFDAGGAAPTETTWSTTDKATEITLSNGNLTAGSSSASFRSVRGTTSKSSGKWYFEVEVTNTVNSFFVGIASATAGLTNFIGSDAQGFGRYYNGQVYNNNAVLATETNTGIPIIIMVAVDLDADKLWFGRTGTWRTTGDPSLGTGGYAMSLATVFPAGTVKQGDTVTGKFTSASLTYTPPTGFTAWG